MADAKGHDEALQIWEQGAELQALFRGDGFLRGCLTGSSGGGRPLSSLSNRLTTAVVLSFVRRDCRKQPLRRGVGVVEGINIVGVDRDALVEVKDVGAEVYRDLESVRRRRGFRSIGGKCI